jgi:predicted O-methyltransferase YrrM
MLPAVLTDAIASGEWIRSDGSRTPLHANVTGREAQRLYDVVRTLQPDASVEIGLAQGVSALAIAQALHDTERGLHHVIDPFQSVDWENIGLANLARAGVEDRVHFYEAFPEEVIPSLPEVSFAFIDGWHLFDVTLGEFVLVDKRLAVGGLIGFHDLWLSSLQKVLRYILANRKYRIHHDVAPEAVSSRQRRNRRLSMLARRIPRASRILRPEVLKPGPDLGLPGRNMVFIEKMGADDRDWHFHRQF